MSGQLQSGDDMSLKSVKVASVFEPPFKRAEDVVQQLFHTMVRSPEEGAIRVGGERHVLMRCESLFLGWFDAMVASFGEETAREFIYNTAREIGRSDSVALSERLKLTEAIDRLASGPVHFSHAGWAFVDILEDSAPAEDENYFIHYHHPNTFESEVVQRQGRDMNAPVCLFSAGYSAGWCSHAYGIELHGREIACTALGHKNCEFIMATADKLDAHEARLKS